MDETTTNEKPDTDNLIQKRRDIERLWLEGLSTHEIADALGLDPRSVGQNLRALRNRRARAAARQQEVVTMTQCATVFHEAMEGWERSKSPKRTTTVEDKARALQSGCCRIVGRNKSAQFRQFTLSNSPMPELRGLVPAYNCCIVTLRPAEVKMFQNRQSIATLNKN